MRKTLVFLFVALLFLVGCATKENEKEEISDEIEENDKIVRRKELNTKPMDEEEAMLQMEMLGHDFFIYKDRDTKRICILYKRKDGNYGLIETK